MLKVVPDNTPRVMPLEQARQRILIGSCYDRSRGTGKLIVANTGKVDVREVTISAECGDGAAVTMRETFTVGPLNAGKFLIRPFPLKKAFVCGLPVIDTQIVEARLS